MKFLTLIAIVVGFLWTDAATADWKGSTAVDPMTDEVAAGTAFGTSEDNQYGLAFKCYANGQYEVYVFFGEYFTDDAHTIEYRIDKNEASTFFASGVSNIRGSVANSNEDFVLALVAALKPATKIVLRGTPYREAPITFTVPLRGFTKAFNTCNSVTQ